MRISNEMLDKLGDYFVAERIGERTNQTFEQFLLGIVHEQEKTTSGN